MSSPSGAGVYPPFVANTDTDHGAYVTVSTFTMMFLMILFTVIRVVYRYQIVSVMRLDDYFLMLAMGFAIVQSICVQLAKEHGLGRHRSSLSDANFDRFEKFNYASQLLLIAVLVSAKTSLVCLLEALQPKRSILLVCRATKGLIALWGIAAIIALAVQCGVHRPWQSRPGRCVDQRALYTSIGVMNIVTDLIIMILPAIIMRSVQTNLKRRVLVTALFAPRILVVAATIVQLAVVPSWLHSSDLTWTETAPAIWTQIMMNLSVIFACLPSLQQFLVKLQPNMTSMKIPESVEYGHGSASRYGANSRNSPHHFNGSRRHHQLQSGKNSITTTSQNRDPRQRFADSLRPDVGEGFTTIQHETDKDPKDGSSIETHGSQDMIIRKDVQYAIHYEQPAMAM